MLLEIHGHHFPGRTWHFDGEACDNVHVGIQVRREPQDLVPGDSETGTWTVPIDVTQRDGAIDFRGPAVQGRRGERFVYLTWGHVHDDGRFTMFRRAKLMLADVEHLLGGGPNRRVVASVHLTDECGGPRCARLRPPALVLTTEDGHNDVSEPSGSMANRPGSYGTARRSSATPTITMTTASASGAQLLPASKSTWGERHPSGTSDLPTSATAAGWASTSTSRSTGTKSPTS